MLEDVEERTVHIFILMKGRIECRRYKCEGCKTLWDSKNHVVEHDIQNKITFFCLNCEDWIRKKENVFVEGWSLFDNDGYLRHDV